MEPWEERLFDLERNVWKANQPVAPLTSAQQKALNRSLAAQRGVETKRQRKAAAAAQTSMLPGTDTPTKKKK